MQDAFGRGQRLLVLGGGPVGCELSQVYASFGVAVTLVETSPHLLSSEDDWVGDALAEHLSASGVDVRTGTTLVEVAAVDGGARATLRPADTDDAKDDAPGDEHVEVDRVLVVTGRAPSGDDLGLELLGVAVDRRHQTMMELVAEAMKELGWEKRKVKFSGLSLNGYLKGTEGERSLELTLVKDDTTGRLKLAPEDLTARMIATATTRTPQAPSASAPM